MKKIIGLFLLFSLFGCTRHISTKFELPSIINSGMVLQRNTDINLWGKASPGKKIEITTSWGIRKSARADKTGRWIISVGTGEAGGPYEIAFQTKDTSVVLNDILIGEVWLCAGQSNMEMSLSGWPPVDTINNSAGEIAGADFPQIRLFTVARNTATKPLENCRGIWVPCSPRTVAGFSAAAYFFGREIYQKLGIPIGLIHSSWGGTPAEAWTSKEFLTGFPVYSSIVDSFKYAEAELTALMNWLDKLTSVFINNDDVAFYATLDYNDDALFAADYDDSGWPVMPVPSKWEENELPGFDGIVWFRKNITIPAGSRGKELILQLGPIDDMDVAYMNGKEIGRTMERGKWKEERKYAIPAGTLHEGNNVLAVRVIDNGGGGGIYGPGDITLADKSGNSINLSGEWRYMPVAEINGSTLYFYDDENNYSSRPAIKLAIGPYTPTTLYNAMIHPLIPYTLRGVIWYQGEANVGRGFEYRTLFPAMVASWRKAWNQGDFPFYYVQIAPWEYWDEELSPAAELREAQLMALKAVANTGMVVTTDIGNPVNIHPSNKQEVGRRLALWALVKNYGFDTLVYSGPLYDTIAIAGNKIIVSFTHEEGGLAAKNGPLTWFEVAGSDQEYYPADAVIKGNTVIVSSAEVPLPVAVRFGWSATAEPNLFNTAGLPASPFRSDNWKRLSEQ